jgi:hypothetical protein
MRYFYLDPNSLGTRHGLSWINAWTNVKNTRWLRSDDVLFVRNVPEMPFAIYWY